MQSTPYRAQGALAHPSQLPLTFAVKYTAELKIQIASITRDASCVSRWDRTFSSNVFSSLLSVTNIGERSCLPAVGRGAEPSLPGTGQVLLRASLSAQLVAVQHHAVAALPNVTSMSFGPSAAMVLVQVRARPALLNDRAAQNHRAGARRSAQSLRVDVHGGLTTVSASRSFPAAAPPDPSSCARRGRWASADAAGPLYDPTRLAKEELGRSPPRKRVERR